jgi:NADH:ubiquinone oxidoreductase subunit E
MLTGYPELTAEQSGLVAEIDALVERHGGGRDALIPVLADLRERHHEISDLAMQAVADRLGVPPVEVYGVVSFYAFLGTARTGRYVIRLCRTLSCHFAEVTAVARALEQQLGVPFGETSADGRFTAEWTNCVGMCDQAPAMLVNERVYGNLTPDRVGEILAELRAVDADGVSPAGEP